MKKYFVVLDRREALVCKRSDEAMLGENLVSYDRVVLRGIPPALAEIVCDLLNQSYCPGKQV